MISLKDLTALYLDNKAKREAEAAAKAKEEAEVMKKKLDAEFKDITSVLEQRLIGRAEDGHLDCEVARFNVEGNIDIEFLLENSGVNICEAKGVEKNLTGQFKRVYDYLRKNNLNPKIECFREGWFMLMVTWSAK